MMIQRAMTQISYEEISDEDPEDDLNDHSSIADVPIGDENFDEDARNNTSAHVCNVICADSDDAMVQMRMENFMKK